tara:strand:- start:3144 stop:5192 length:2049 start_codon:yes stop_codon:yes gene_type:complete
MWHYINIKEKIKYSDNIYMSLIVLNSKGEDPEDFSNYMTENIEFPANAEVCLVGSHINRKLLITQEVQFSSQGNRLAFQYGRGNLLARTTVASYTPHAPYSYEFSDKNQIFPVKFTGIGEVEAAANAFLNDKENTPISTLVGGWECDVPTSTGQFTLHNLMRIPDRIQSQGTTKADDIFVVPGSTSVNSGGNNSDLAPQAGDFSIISQYLPQTMWPEVDILSSNVSTFIDTNPLFNTDVGKRLGTFTPLPSNENLDGGGWNWQFKTVGFATEDNIASLRGGIMCSGGSIINPNKGDEMNGTNSVLNKLSNNTDFSVWWQVDRYNATTGVTTIDFYKRPVLPPGGKAYTTQMDGAILWGSVATAASITPASVRVGMRPINNPGALGYVLEAYAGIVTTATNQFIGAVLPATLGGLPGVMKVTDPLDFTEAPADKCSLYRHLPLYQGVTLGQGGFGGCILNAVHHGDHDGLMGAAEQTASLDYTFGFGPQTPQGQIIEKFDAANYHEISRATIGYALGFTSSFDRQSATNMVPAPGAGVAAPLPLGQTIPLAHSLVVSLPDLPISGFFGNSTGSASAGTLGINSGGTSAPIIGVIPFALGNAPMREASPIPGINRDSRGTFYSAPMENWIKLKNPHSFKLSSLRCRLTDELGTKPSVLAGNTTVTIKIKAPRSGDIDRGLQIQG